MRATVVWGHHQGFRAVRILVVNGSASEGRGAIRTTAGEFIIRRSRVVISLNISSNGEIP